MHDRTWLHREFHVLKLITITPLELVLVVIITGLLNSFNGGEYGINTGLFMGLVVLLAPRNRCALHHTFIAKLQRRILTSLGRTHLSNCMQVPQMVRLPASDSHDTAWHYSNRTANSLG
jgi:hypothetical protein